MLIESSNDGVKSLSALHKVEVFQFFSAGFLLENFRRTFAAYLRANLPGKPLTSLGGNHTYTLGIRSNYICIISFKKNAWKIH